MGEIRSRVKATFVDVAHVSTSLFVIRDSQLRRNKPLFPHLAVQIRVYQARLPPGHRQTKSLCKSFIGVVGQSVEACGRLARDASSRGCCGIAVGFAPSMINKDTRHSRSATLTHSSLVRKVARDTIGIVGFVVGQG